MGSVSFAELANAILASVATGGALHSKAASTLHPFGERDPSLDHVSLKGKLDLSLWRDIGNEDDEDEDLDDFTGNETSLGQIGKTRDNSSTPPPPLSPLLAPLLGTKGKEAGSIKQTSSYLKNTLGVPANKRGLIMLEDGSAYHQMSNDYTSSSVVERVLSPTLSPLNENRYEDEKVTPSSLGSSGRDDDGGSARHHQQRRGSREREQAPVLRQPSQHLETTWPSIISEQGKPQSEEEKLVSFLPFLSSFIGSSQLLRGFQSQQGTDGDNKVERTVTKRVEFTEQLKMEQLATAAAIELAEKTKRNEVIKEGSAVGTRSRSGSAVVRRQSSKVPTDILQEIRKMSLASQDALEEKKKKKEEEKAGSAPSSARKFGKKIKYKRRKPEEVFTDKDRAAAVTLGSKDIKQSLKAKKKRDRKMRLSISFLSGEDYVIAALLGEASYQMKVKNNAEAALLTLNKALEIQPNHKGALVARSQCYLKLGDAESALKDAELTWDPDNKNDRYIQGLYQYAEALFQLGEFEKSLIAFHRGHRIRKDQDGFRIGIQKCQEAIKRAIGDKSATNIPDLDTVLPLIQEFDDAKARIPEEEKKTKSDDDVLKKIVKHKEDFKMSSPQEMKVKEKLITRELMGQLYLDKSYLKKFVNRPEVINQQGLAKGLRDEACEALQYLEGREHFWRQQNPLYSRKNFTTMMKAHAHDAACRRQSVAADPSIAKYLSRRSSAIIADSQLPLPPLKRRSSSQVDLNLQRQTPRNRSVDRVSSERKLESTSRRGSQSKNVQK